MIQHMFQHLQQQAPDRQGYSGTLLERQIHEDEWRLVLQATDHVTAAHDRRHAMVVSRSAHTLHRIDESTAPTTHQAANSLCCHSSTARTVADTVHLVCKKQAQQAHSTTLQNFVQKVPKFQPVAAGAVTTDISSVLLQA